MRCLAALHSAGLVEARQLPGLATWLLANGLETPPIVELASLDLQSFYSADARDLFDELLRQLSIEPLSEKDGLSVALGAAGRLHLDGSLSSKRMLGIGNELAKENSYPSEPEGVMELLALEDEWGGDWRSKSERSSTRERIMSDVRRIAEAALDESPEAQAADPEFLRLAIPDRP